MTTEEKQNGSLYSLPISVGSLITSESAFDVGECWLGGGRPLKSTLGGKLRSIRTLTITKEALLS